MTYDSTQGNFILGYECVFGGYECNKGFEIHRFWPEFEKT